MAKETDETQMSDFSNCKIADLRIHNLGEIAFPAYYIAAHEVEAMLVRMKPPMFIPVNLPSLYDGKIPKSETPPENRGVFYQGIWVSEGNCQALFDHAKKLEAKVERLGAEVEEMMKVDYWQDRHDIVVKERDRYRKVLKNYADKGHYLAQEALEEK